MSELSPDAKSLIDTVRRVEQPTLSDKERLRARILAAAPLALDPSASAGPSPIAAEKVLATKVLAAGTSTKVLGSGILLIGMLVGSHQLFKRTFVPPEDPGTAEPGLALEPPISPSSESSKPALEAEIEVDPPEVVAPQRAVVEPESHPLIRRPPRASKKSVEAKSTLEDERDLLGRARIALGERQPALALTLAEEYQHRFSSGILAEEGQATRIFALCALGRDARAELAQFIEAAPHSPLAERLSTACRGPIGHPTDEN